MRISDTLRQECMPEMVYALCKLAGNEKYKRDMLKRLITLDSSDVSYFNKPYNFAVECGFLYEAADGIIKSNINKNQLGSFLNFRYAVFKNIFQTDGTTFCTMAKWFLSQSTNIYGYKSAQDLATALPTDIFGGIERDYVLGFRFWMEALGLGMFSKSGNSEVLVFAANYILEDYLYIEKPFENKKVILAKNFFERIVRDCPVFSVCISGNNVNLALSMALRVLHLNDVITLKFTTDSSDIWHLEKSISLPHTNDITEIIVR